MSTRRIHFVACTLHSEDFGTEDFDRVSALADRLERYARRLGFDVSQEATSEVWGERGQDG